MDRHNISINEDLPKFANAIDRIEEYGYDLKRLIAELNYIQHSDGKKRALEITTKELEERIANLRQQESMLQDKILFTFGKSTCTTNLQIWDSVQAS